MNVFTFVGGIKGLAAENNSAKKWFLNTPEQAKDKCSTDYSETIQAF